MNDSNDNIELNKKVKYLAQKYERIEKLIESLVNEKEEINKELLEMLGPGTTIKFNNGLTVQTIASSKKIDFDDEQFKTDYPDVYKKYLKETYSKAHTQVISDK